MEPEQTENNQSAQKTPLAESIPRPVLEESERETARTATPAAPAPSAARERPHHAREFILFGILCVILLAVLAGVFIFSKWKAQQIPAEIENAATAIEAPKPNPFAGITLEARAAMVKNIASGETLYARNENQELPLASLTKLLTTVAVDEIITPVRAVTIRAEDLAPEGDWAFVTGETFALQDLIDFTLISSSNDGAAALAYAAQKILKPETTAYTKVDFINYMNILAGKLGMEDAHFENETGLDIATGASATGSAKDVTKLVEYIVKNKPELLDATRSGAFTLISTQGMKHNVDNTNTIINALPNIIGSKTGYTETAGGNLTVVIDPALNAPIIITVLGSSKEGRFTDVQKLTDAVLADFAQDAE